MKNTLRIIDANFNRAREGLRTIEDAVRFYYELGPRDIQKLKIIRHTLSKETEKHFALIELRASRDTVCDRGKKLDVINREDMSTTVGKNFMRAGEALRTMEEYSKITVPEASGVFHNLRFRLYKAEKEILMKISRRRLSSPFLYVVYETGQEEKNIGVYIKKALEEKPDVIEIRYRGEHAGEFLKLAISIRKIIPENILYIVNGRADISFLCNADGLALGANDIAPEEARKLLPCKVIFLYAESLEELYANSKKDADYMLFSPAGKPPETVLLTETAKKVNIPFAVMAETETLTAENCLKTGADGIAVLVRKGKNYRADKILQKIKKGLTKNGK